MSASRLRIVLAHHTEWPPHEFREQRQELGLSEQAVADALLLSLAQVRGLETGAATPFYNEVFYQRARAKYVAMLNKARGAASPSLSAVERREDTERARLTLINAVE